MGISQASQIQYVPSQTCLVLPQIYSFFRTVSSIKNNILPFAEHKNREVIPHIYFFLSSLPDTYTWSYHLIYLTHLLLSVPLSYCNPVSTITHWDICISLLTYLPASCPFQFILDLESEWSFYNTKFIQHIICLKNIRGFPLSLG